MTEIQITAVGDLMVKRYIISDAKQSDGTYSFATLFARVAPYLKQAEMPENRSERLYTGIRTESP
ncbi:CapA family protein [Paenibacillus wynnii]|uniref:Uncharacterized protein n=1 Tax=Paenibacillus wynnii TaxID=268407 RepID=A0A098M848_9BACL|nr:CapA family protein [Paenibacillus wynnii]KGE18715.1 hypothetical protein PWYN_04525 [Paenibacillus wynnii]